MSRPVQSSVLNLASAMQPEVQLTSARPAAVASEGNTVPIRKTPLMDSPREPQDATPASEPDKAVESSPAPKVAAMPARGLSAPFSQEATKLVYKLFRVSSDPALSSVLFCGIDTAQSSSSICARAAEILAAQVQKSVCVVDANLRAPALHTHFGLKNQRGFSDAIVQPGPLRGFAQQILTGNLWVMTAGTAQADSMVLASGEQLRSRMLELRSLFDYVLIDAAPAGLFLDAVVLGQMVDGAVLVIDSSSTKRETAFRAKEALEDARVRILGAVLLTRKS